MIKQTPPANLIHTKLNQPRIAAHLVERKRLYAQLDLHRPLTVIVAPAGYGKTVLASQWIAQCGMRCAWLSLDAGDSQLTTFVDYLLAAVERLFPDVVAAIRVGSGHGITVSYDAVARRLADELDALDESFVLVLDDYHLVDQPAIHHFLTEFLQFPPRNLNLLISSRIDPPLPLAAMRAGAHLAELRTSDLRFTLDEAAGFLRQELEQDVDDKTLALLEESTDGWITGLRLATLFLRDQEDVTRAAAQFKVSSRPTADYLALEVLAKQRPAVQSFLLKTSILNRMCPALCDALLATGLAAHQGQQILDALDSQNLFLMMLDDSQRWYSYHPLFRQLLQTHLRAVCTPAEIASLYSRASHWCAEQELVDEAIAYAAAAGDVAFVVAIIEEHRHQAMNAEHWQELERWLRLVEGCNIEAWPQLLLLEAWTLHKRQDLSAVLGRLDLAEALLADHPLSEAVDYRLRSEIDALRSQQYFRQFDGERAYQSAHRTLEQAPPEYAGVRGMAWLFRASGYFIRHGLQPALELLPDNAGNMEPLPVAESVRILLGRCFLYWLAGDMPSLRSTANELLSFSSLHNLSESVVWARYFHGCACYQQNDLAAAGDDFLAVRAAQHLAPGFALIEGSFGLASVLQAQGNEVEAHAVVGFLLEYVEQAGNDTAKDTVEAFQAYLALLQGRPHEALKWVVDAARSIRSIPIVTFFAPPIAAAAVLIRHGTPASLAEAEQMLGRIDALLNETQTDRFRVDVLIQQSLLCAARRQLVEALAALETAIVLAERGDLVQSFVDAGPPLADLLAKLKLSDGRDAFVQRIRQASHHAASRKSGRGDAAQGLFSLARQAQPRHPDLIELLTNRELEVLQLLALRLSNVEIARELSVTSGTVKQHTINIFRKLHVENRRQAIVQAKAMGFKIETPYPF